MNADNSSTRRWYQLHKSSWFVLALVMIVLVALNLPYEYGDIEEKATYPQVLSTAWYRTEFILGGWPLRYLEIRKPEYSESPERDWTTLALAVDLLVGFVLLAIVVAAYEQRRRRRTKRWQLTLSDLCLLMLVVCSVFGTWNMMAHRYRTQQNAMFQLHIEGGTVASQLFLPKIIIGPSERSPWRGHFHAWLIDQLWNHERPTAARLTRINDESMSALLQLREIKTLVVEDPSVPDGAVAALKSFRYLERLQIDGVHLTDACVPTLQRLTRLRFLRIRDAQLSDDAISKLAALPNLVSLDVEGTPLTDRGLAAIATHRGMRDLNIARTQITEKGLRVLNGHPNLTRLWLASSASTPESPAVRQVQLSNLPLLESLHLPSRIDSLELSNLPMLAQLPSKWETNEFWLPIWVFESGFKMLWVDGSPFPQPMEGGVNAKHLSLRSVPGLTTLNLDSRNILSLELDVASLEHFSTTGAIGYLRFWTTRARYVIDDRLAQLMGRNTSLRSLALAEASLTRYGWAQLSSLRELQSLDLAGSNVTDLDLGVFSAAHKLESLSLVDTEISSDGWDKLPRFALLQSLNLSGTAVKQIDLEDLSELQALNVANTPLESLRLKELPKLAGGINVTSSGSLVFEAVNLPKLEALELEHQSFERLLLDNLPALSHLDLAGSSVDDAMLCNVGQLKSLQRLLLGNTDITDTTLDRLGDLQYLHHLDLENTAVTDAGLAVFGPQLQVSVLNLTGTDVSDDGLRHLSGQRSLDQLFLGRTNVSGPGLQHLSNVTTLQRLSLEETSVTSESIAHLRNLQGLKVLRLSYTKIDDSSFQHLNRLPKLETLFLNGTAVTDAGIAVYDLPRGLKELDISKSAVTAYEASRIAEKRRNIKVYW